MRRGTRVGGSQKWGYHGAWFERKTKPQVWKFTFNATKNQKRKGKFPPGGKLIWGIKGKQYVTKLGKGNRYQTKLVGRKVLLAKKMPNQKKWSYTKQRY